jgi:hypothetical protein
VSGVRPVDARPAAISASNCLVAIDEIPRNGVIWDVSARFMTPFSRQTSSKLNAK